MQNLLSVSRTLLKSIALLEQDNEALAALFKRTL